MSHTASGGPRPLGSFLALPARTGRQPHASCCCCGFLGSRRTEVSTDTLYRGGTGPPACQVLLIALLGCPCWHVSCAPPVAQRRH